MFILLSIRRINQILIMHKDKSYEMEYKINNINFFLIYRIIIYKNIKSNFIEKIIKLNDALK